MADNLGVPGGAAGPAATDEIGGVHYQRIKLIHGADGVNAGDVSDANPLPIDDAGGSITIDNAQLSVVGGGTEAAAMRVTIANNSTGVLSVDDNGGSLTVDDGGSTLGVDDGGGSLTVDNATLSVTGGGAEASALRVTIASDSTGVLSVDDNGSSLTVDSAQLPASLGQKTMANSLAVVVASDQDSLTVDSAQLPASLGQKTTSASMSVTLSSDHDVVGVSFSPTKMVSTKVAATTIGATASTYTSGDVIGSKITLPDVLSDDSYGRLLSITLQSVESTTPKAANVFFFDADPSGSTITNSTGLDIVDADDEKVIAVVKFASTDFTQHGNNTYATKTIDILLKAPSGATLYAVITSAEDSWVWAAANGMAAVFMFEHI